MPEPIEPDDRRNRRRVGMLWLSGGLIGALAIVAVVAAASTLRVARGGVGTQELAGAGFAPVLGAPPADIPEPSPSPTFGFAPRFSTPGATVDSVAGAGNATTPVTHGPTVAPPTQLPPYPVPPTGPTRDHGLHLLLTSTIDDVLRPGVIRTLHISVRNPDHVVVQLYRLDVRVGAPPAVGCDRTWVRVGHYRYAGGAKQLVQPGATVQVDVPIELKNLTVDQNACQGTTFPLTLSGLGVSTP